MMAESFSSYYFQDVTVLVVVISRFFFCLFLLKTLRGNNVNVAAKAS